MSEAIVSCFHHAVSRSRRLGHEPKLPTERKASSEFTKSILSKAFFTWAFRIIRTANFRPLQLEDFEYINPNRTVAAKYALFRAAMASYRERQSASPVLWALVTAYRSQLLVAAVACVVYGGGQLAIVVIYKTFVAYLQRSHDAHGVPGPSFAEGVGLLFATAGALFVTMLARTHCHNTASLIGGEMKTLLGSLMFEKSFVVSPLARKPNRRRDSKDDLTADPHNLTWSQGAIINLMSSNTDRVENCMRTIFDVLLLIPVIPLNVGLAYWLLGWPAAVGYSYLFISIPYVTWMATRLTYKRQTVDKYSQERVDLVNDIVHAVRFIKYCAWEAVFSERYRDVRTQEVNANKALISARVRMYLSGFTGGNIPILVSLAIYTHLHSGNNTIVVMPFYYMAAAFRQLLMLAPIATINVANGYNAILDIQDFLVAEDQAVGQGFVFDSSLDSGIQLRNTQFIWGRHLPEHFNVADRSDDRLSFHEKVERFEEKPSERGEFRLSALNLVIGAGELVALVGQVGSGKSALASALVGDMAYSSGEATMRSKPSYCPQRPWIQNATVQENITFGRSFDPKFYARIIHACALDRDISEMSDGDRTILGELGINISGGQKQRIQLARTLYQDRDLIILDDPLSAVDAHTGDYIFQEAILKLLARKCRILVTQQLHILERCDRIIWLDQGVIKASGSYRALQQNIEFSYFLGTCKQREPVDVDRVDNEKKQLETAVSDMPQLQLMQDEEVNHQRLRWREYQNYLRLSTPLSMFVGTLVILLALGSGETMAPVTISWWARGDYKGLTIGELAIVTTLAITSTWPTWCSFSYITESSVLQSSGVLSIKALDKLLKAPMSFFDTTPTGRILNIFTSDINALDVELPAALTEMLFLTVVLLGFLALNVAIVPLIASMFVPWALVSSWVITIYKRAPLQIKRLDRTFASFYISKLTEGIVGRSSIRCCAREADFVKSLRTTIDDLNGIHFTSYACQAWVEVAQSLISTALYCFTGFMVLIKRHSLNPALAFVVLLAAHDLTSYIQGILLLLTNVQRTMASVGRITRYHESLPQEPPHRKATDPSQAWPEKGHIQAMDISMRYRPGLPLVLHGLTFDFQGGERIGIVGRTGSGKSSLLATLIRAVEVCSGSIKIDGVDISQIGLHTLRNQIAVIPQDPILFKGTIRSNLLPYLSERSSDPSRLPNGGAQSYTDDSLLSALTKAFLIPPLSASLLKSNAEASSINTSARSSTLRTSRANLLNLDSPVASGGSNLSQGERQLLMIARAIVRDTPIVLCDEATSAVDPDTDKKVQESMRNSFQGKTFISIAHRISTIVHSDKIVVLDSGRAVEFGSPRELYNKPSGHFRSLCVRSNVVIDD